MTLSTLISLFILSLVLAIISIIKGDWDYGDWYVALGISSIVATIVFGIMFYAYAALDWKEVIITEYEPSVVKSDNRVYVEYDFTPYGFEDKGYKVFESKEDYDKITDSTQFYILIGVNHYGNKYEGRIAFGDSLCKYEQGVPIPTPLYIENKYDYTGNEATIYNFNK